MSSNRAEPPEVHGTAPERWRYAVALVVTALSVILTITVWHLLSRRIESQSRDSRAADADERLQAVEYDIRQHLTVVDALRAFYIGSKDVEPDEFRAFATPLLERHLAVKRVQWVPVVPASTRAAHVKKIRTLYVGAKMDSGSFEIRERGHDGVQRAGERQIYYPVAYEVPEQPNGAGLGLDWGTDKRVQEMFQSALDSNESRAIPLERESDRGVRLMFLVATPIYDNLKRQDTESARRRALTGFVVGEMDVAEVAMSALGRLRMDNLEIEWDDPFGGFAHIIRVSGGELEYVRKSESESTPDARTQRTKEIAGYRWNIRSVATPRYLAAQVSPLPTIVLVGGLVISLLLGIYLSNLAGRTARTEQQVRMRTVDLRRANLELEDSRSELARATNLAVSATKAKSAFLANMSHEIRTPLNGVIGVTELMRRTELTPEQQEYQKMVKSSADALLLLINDILDFSKIEAGRMELDERPFALRDTVTGAVHSLAVQATEKRLELACRIPHDVPDALVGDAGRLRQILINLVGNSIKFTQKGEIVVEFAVEEQSPESVTLHVLVRDTGIGISEEKRAAIFDAFTQADASTTRRFGGTGLGLAISSQLAGLMHGRMWTESVEGQGSTFHFTAQFGIEDPTKRRRRAEEDATGMRGTKVLLVDDNATHRTIIREIVDAWGMRSESVESGAAALEAMRRAVAADDPFRLALVDVLMTDMDGIELTEAIRAEPTFAGVSIILLSAMLDPERSSRARFLGVTRWLTKPIHSSELFDEISEELAGKSAEASVAPRSVQSKPARYLRVLLAEDGQVNRKVATRLLELRGHDVTVAVNGREALDRVRSDPPYDVVLMDVQMPEMDGIEATQAIRAREASQDDRLPIVAMTAHAMKGDRERCLEAGMDGYVSKPLDVDEMYFTLESCARVASAAPRAAPSITTLASLTDSPSAPSTATAVATDIVDWQRAERMVGGDSALLIELARDFLEEAPTLVSQMQVGIESGRADGVRRAAHTLKSSAGVFCSDSTVAAASDLEAIGRDRADLDGAGAALTTLEVELEKLTEELVRRTK